MGEVKLNFAGWTEAFLDTLDTRLEAFAERIVDDAQARAPVRKTTPGRRRGRLSFFLPENRAQGVGTYHFGKVSLTSSEISDAAKRIGINLGASVKRRARAGKGPLLIQERGPGRRQKRADYRIPRNFYTTNAAGDVTRIKNRKSVVISPREARKVEILNKERAAVFAGMTYNRRTGEFEEDVQPGHLRRSITEEQTTESMYHMRYTIRAGASYARYVEFPTSKTRAQPFLLPALKNARSRLQPWMKSAGR